MDRRPHFPHDSVLLGALALVLLLLTAHPASAIQPDGSVAALEIERPIDQTRYLSSTSLISGSADARAYQSALAAELGDGWRVTSWNQFADSPRTIEGPGIIVAPGGLAFADRNTVESIARSFIAQHTNLFQTDGSDLITTRIAHGAHRWGVLFTQELDGVRIVDSQVVLAFHDNGRLFAFGANLYRNIDVPRSPSISPSIARSLARDSVPYDPSSTLVPSDDDIVIMPLHTTPGAVDYRLAFRTDVPTTTPYGLWRTWVDAHSGNILYRENQVEHFYEGDVEADVEIFGYCDGQTPNTPLANLDIVITNIGTTTTDDNGAFSIAGDSGTQTITAELNGPDFDVNCIGCGGDAQISGPIDPNAAESIYFDGTNSQDDERDVFYFANLTKKFVQSIHPGFDVPKYDANVSWDNTCNANWTGTTINFFREGGGCGNTGRIGDVVAHEFGHGVQNWATGGGQGPEGLGEGNSDILGTFMTDSPHIGPGFTLDDCLNPLRNCDNELQYPEDLSGSVHSSGRIICAFNWDCRLNLEASLGAAVGKAKTAELWHFARHLYMDASNNQQDQVDRYLWVDDDNGDLNDRTPNYDDICAAAAAHGYGCGPELTRIEIVHVPLGDTTGEGPFTIAAEIRTFVDGTEVTADTHEVLFATNGSGFSPIAMANVGGFTFEATLPLQDPGTAIAYYLRVADPGSVQEEFEPANAPVEFHEFAQGAFAELLNHEMETDLGYDPVLPGDTSTDGMWERADPVEVLGGSWQPEDDHTPVGTDCWITGNPPPGSAPFTEELDGLTSLLTPAFDVTGANIIQGTFWYWLKVGGNDDHLDLQVSYDGGTSWHVAAHLNVQTTPNWAQASFRVIPWDVTMSDSVMFKFVAEDGEPTSIVEALVDDFFVERLTGGTTATDDVSASSAPASVRLGLARPNPFNPSTSIDYTVPAESRVALAVYDVAGRVVRTLVDEVQPSGLHITTWDGTSDADTQVSSGIYYYRLTVGDWSETRSMVLLK